jgi:predicted nucleic acid-binding protein
VELIQQMNRVFLDTSYAVALSATTDENHARAAELADELGTKALCEAILDFH